MEEKWAKSQVWEREWWMSADCPHEQEKYKGDEVAKLMQILQEEVKDKTVIDIGCGPLSLLQRIKVKQAVALDPIHYGELEKAYDLAGIKRIIKCGEDLTTHDGLYDEAWIYNCLQHTKDPSKILENAMSVAKRVRIFEWIYIDTDEGHLHVLTPGLLKYPFHRDEWSIELESVGKLNSSGLHGDYFVGIYSRP